MGKETVRKEPWEECPNIWKTKSQYFTWLRGALRRIWADYPLRKEWKKKALRPVTKEEKRQKLFHPSTKNVGQCVFCEEWFAGSKLEVDHKIMSYGCRDYETAEKFLWHCAGLIGEDFQLTCKPCHKIKSYAEQHEVSFDEARAIKEAIQIEKAGVEKTVIEEAGEKPGSNAKIRRKQLIEILMNKGEQ